MKRRSVLSVGLAVLLSACGAWAGSDAPLRAGLTPDGLTLEFDGGRGPCLIAAGDGTATDSGWWQEPAGCPDVTYVEVIRLGPADGTEILFAPSYTGPLEVSGLPPGRVRVVVGGTAGTGWFEGQGG
jgi:hypothetical protein